MLKNKNKKNNKEMRLPKSDNRMYNHDMHIMLRKTIPYHTIPYHTCLKGQDAGNE
jgi:hypothetical protein